MATPASTLVKIARKRPTVPDTCTLDPLVVIATIMHAEHPCDRCNNDRSVCKGSPRSANNLNPTGL